MEPSRQGAPHVGASLLFEGSRYAISPYIRGDSTWFVFLENR